MPDEPEAHAVLLSTVFSFLSSLFYFTDTISVTGPQALVAFDRPAWMAWLELQRKSSAKTFVLLLIPRLNTQQRYVLTRQTDGKTLMQRHTPHCLASSRSATVVASSAKDDSLC